MYITSVRKRFQAAQFVDMMPRPGLILMPRKITTCSTELCCFLRRTNILWRKSLQVKQAALTAPIAGQPEITATAGRCHKLQRSQGTSQRSSKAKCSSKQGAVTKEPRGRTWQLLRRTQWKPAE